MLNKWGRERQNTTHEFCRAPFPCSVRHPRHTREPARHLVHGDPPIAGPVGLDIYRAHGLAHSGVAVAVRAGMPQTDISSEDAVRQAVLAAPSLSYSIGPSGVALMKLFERWGIADAVQARLVVPPPGVPVGALIARGEVALGFQQLSELIHVEGVAVVGPLPAAIQITTPFSAGCCTTSVQADAVRGLLDFMSGPDAADAKRQQGMEPA